MLLLGAVEVIDRSGNGGIDIYAVFPSTTLFAEPTYYAVGLVYGEGDRIRDKFEYSMNEFAADPKKNFFKQPKGRRNVTPKFPVGRYELLVVDRHWTAEVLPDWFVPYDETQSVLCNFVGRDKLNRLARGFANELGEFFDTAIQRLETEIANQKQMRAELEAEVAKTQRMELERRWSAEETARLKKKAAWKKISRELNHTFGNALKTIEGAANALHEIGLELDERVEAEWQIKHERRDYSNPSEIFVPTLSSRNAPFPEFLDSAIENLFWVLAKFHKGVDRARPIVDEFKRYAATTGGVRLQEASVSKLAEIIHNVTIEEEVTYLPDIDPTWNNVLLDLDEKKLFQVFSELIQNAKTIFEAHKREGKLRITISLKRFNPTGQRQPSYGAILRDETEQFLMVTVQDNGPGVPEEDKTELFAPFFTQRPEGTTQGSGQGLSICEQIIEAHYGRLVEDGVFGRGAKFRIFLPTRLRGQ